MTGVTAAGVSGAIVLLAVAWFTIVHSVSLVSVLAVYVRLRSRRSQAMTSASRPVVAPATAPAISIVFAARGEQATIVEQVRALLLLDYPRFEVVVVSEGEAGGTPDMAEMMKNMPGGGAGAMPDVGQMMKSLPGAAGAGTALPGVSLGSGSTPTIGQMAPKKKPKLKKETPPDP